MAIHNGNKDFYLSVLQPEGKTLKISFKTPDVPYTNKITLVVLRPGDSGFVLNKTYDTTIGQVHTVSVEVPYFGEYHVKVSIGVQFIHHDYYIKPVLLLGTHTQKRTYTQADIDDYKNKGLVELALLTGLGIYAKAALAVALTIFTAAQQATSLSNYETSKDTSLFTPRVGWGLRTTFSNAGSYIQIKWEAIDTYGNVQATQYGQIKYIKW